MLSQEALNTIKARMSIIGNTEELNHAIRVAVQVAPTDLPVLITGESGVGKEAFPKIIHDNSARKHNKYVAVNCGAIPEGTIDSELFGHEKGSFTGALGERKGYFEVADGGTIFLDEVGELPLPTQARLLRVLQDGEYYRVGSSELRKTNVRVVAATNVDLIQAIRDGRFRSDLYYRLNAVPIHVPALRDRPNDILPLFTFFAQEFAEKYKRQVIVLDEHARQALKSYYWQGNIRQLKNVAEQISALETDPEISVETLATYLPDESQSRLPQLVRKEPGPVDTEMKISYLYSMVAEMKKTIDALQQTIQQLREERASVYSSPRKTTVPAESNSKVPVRPHHPDVHREDYIEAQEYVEDTLSVDEMEKKMIMKALEKHGGKRKLAAMDLKMSERTLYRKLKEYGLEE